MLALTEGTEVTDFTRRNGATEANGGSPLVPALRAGTWIERRLEFTSLQDPCSL